MKTPEEVRRELDKVVPFKSETKRGKPGKAPHEQVARAGDAGWRSLLLQSDNGPLGCEANVEIALRQAPQLVGRLRFNELTGAAECSSLPWRPCEGWRAWSDTDDTALAIFCQHAGVRVKPSACAAAVQLVAADHPHHPVRAYLDGLTWNGKNPLLDSWLHAYLGVKVEEVAKNASEEKKQAAEAKNAYVRQVGRKWLISAVARAYKPGCKVDHALILEGPQEAGKSSALAALMPDPALFSDSLSDLGTKDSAQDLRGKWLIEIAELSAMKRPEVERVKGFISRAVDHYRPSYGRRSQDFPRQGIFGGTTNSDSYLGDETGGRRFWPVKVGAIDLVGLRKARDQIWAEAVAAYKAGENWWLGAEMKAAATAQQAERRIVDPWEGSLLDWAMGKTELSVNDALGELKVPVERQDQVAANRVSRIFKAHGWERFQYRIGGSRVWGYRRPSEPETPPPDPEGPKGGGFPSPVPQASPLENFPTGDGKASNGAGVTSVTSVTSRVHTLRVDDAPNGSVTHGRGAIESTEISGDTGDTQCFRGFSVTSSANPTGDTLHPTGDTPAWNDEGGWVRFVDRASKTRAGAAPAVVRWARTVGGEAGQRKDGRLWVTLPDGLPLASLRQLAVEAGVEVLSAAGNGGRA